MGKTRRILRVNQLLLEVLTEVIRTEVKRPVLSPLLSIVRVETSIDLHTAKVFISIVGGDPGSLKETLESLQRASGFIAMKAAKRTRLHFFPNLTFLLDRSIEEHFRLESLFQAIQEISSEQSGDSTIS